MAGQVKKESALSGHTRGWYNATIPWLAFRKPVSFCHALVLQRRKTG
ncbi:MAG: hypothetical protein ACD_75C00488G0002 [uncultured bacterium]|nr:MAG: hypothetical protein ACD_75C00488G0002 [uncultured bacterium]